MSNLDLFAKDAQPVDYTVQEMRLLKSKSAQVRRLVKMIKTVFPCARVVQ